MISSMRLPLVICWNGFESGDEDDNARSATLRCDALRMALAQYSSAAPIVSIVQGSVTGPLASCLALSDFIIAADANASFAVNSPTTILQTTGITCKATAESRQSDFSYVAQDLADATDFARFLLSFLPSVIGTAAPVFDAPAHELTVSEQRHIRIAELFDAITDDDTPLYLGSSSDASVALGFARVYGHSVGVITPHGPRDRMLIDARALTDITAFARLCQRFSLPVISSIDEFRFAPEPLGGAAARSDSAMLHDAATLAAIQADNSQLWVHVEAAESSLIRLWANGADESMNLAQLDMMLQHLLAGHAPCAR
jgi:acetyl-CoA carboxylase carboxyltransferase component